MFTVSYKPLVNFDNFKSFPGIRTVTFLKNCKLNGYKQSNQQTSMIFVNFRKTFDLIHRGTINAYISIMGRTERSGAKRSIASD